MNSIQLWDLLDNTKPTYQCLRIMKMLIHLTEKKQKMMPYEMVIADLLMREKKLKKKEKLLEAEREKKKIPWVELRHLCVDDDTFVVRLFLSILMDIRISLVRINQIIHLDVYIIFWIEHFDILNCSNNGICWICIHCWNLFG